MSASADAEESKSEESTDTIASAGTDDVEVSRAPDEAVSGGRPAVAMGDGAEAGSRSTKGGSGPTSVNVTLSVRSILLSVGGVLAVIALGVLVWLVVDKSSEISDLKSNAKNNAHAEKVALDYATGAANMSYEDTTGWLSRLTANTTPELATRLRNAASQMEQLLRPLQWSSTSSPISAKVEAVDGDVYEVYAFVQIVTKNVQAPADGIDTTATYKLTIDKGQDWKITAITSNGTNLDADGAATDPQNPAADNQNQQNQTGQNQTGQNQGTPGN